MKFSDFVGVVVISAVVSVGVYLYLDHKKAQEEAPEEKDVEEPVLAYGHADANGNIFNYDSLQLPKTSGALYQNYYDKKKSLFDRIKSKAGETLVTKKLLDEVDDRDITITIELNKK